MTVKLKIETEKNLKISEIIKQTINVYISGFKQFISLSVVAILASLCMTAAKSLFPISALIAILGMILSVFLLYFTFRANAGFFLLTQSILLGERPTVRESFHQTKGYAGTYFSISLLYSLILVLPIIGIAAAYAFISNGWIKFGVIGLFLIPLLFLATRYSLAIPSTLLAGSGGLESSKRLVKGDFWQVLLINLIFQGVFLGLFRALYTVTEGLTGFWTVILAEIAADVFQILTAPIAGIAFSVMYYVLNKIKCVDTLPLKDAELFNGIGKTLAALKIEFPDSEPITLTDCLPDSTAVCLASPELNYAYFFFCTHNGDYKSVVDKFGDQLKCAGFTTTVGVLFSKMNEDMPFADFFSMIGVTKYEYGAEEDVLQGWLTFRYHGMEVWLNTDQTGTDGGSDVTGIEKVKRDASVIIYSNEIYNNNYSLTEEACSL